MNWQTSTAPWHWGSPAAAPPFSASEPAPANASQSLSDEVGRASSALKSQRKSVVRPCIACAHN
eukprot:4061586-Pyramimonas_sp.AAC.1